MNNINTPVWLLFTKLGAYPYNSHYEGRYTDCKQLNRSVLQCINSGISFKILKLTLWEKRIYDCYDCEEDVFW